jgi:hypothetical protein
MEIWWDLMDMNWICKPKKLWSLGVSTVHLLPENCNLDRESMEHDFPLIFFGRGYCCFFSDCSDVSVYVYKYAQNIMGAYTIFYRHQLLVPSRWIETPIAKWRCQICRGLGRVASIFWKWSRPLPGSPDLCRCLSCCCWLHPYSFVWVKAVKAISSDTLNPHWLWVKVRIDESCLNP